MIFNNNISFNKFHRRHFDTKFMLLNGQSNIMLKVRRLTAAAVVEEKILAFREPFQAVVGLNTPNNSLNLQNKCT